MTRIEAIDEAIVLAGENEELVEKLTAIKASFAKKRSTDKPTKKQKENAEVKEQITAILAEADEPMTATAIGEACGGRKFQQIGALIRQMDNVTKTYTSKGVAVYSLVE